MTMDFADKIGRALDARTSKSESDYCAGELLNCYIRKQFNSIDCMEAVAVVTNSAAVHGADGSMQVEMYPPANSKGAYEYGKRIVTSSLYEATLAVRERGYWTHEMQHEIDGQDYLVRMTTRFNELGQTVFAQLAIFDKHNPGWPAPIEYRAAHDWSDMIFRELRPAYDAFGWRLPIDNVA